MNLKSVGDLAQSYQFRNQNVAMKERMVQLSREMSTGVKADMAAAVSGDFMALASVERSLGALAAHKAAATEAGIFSATMQEALTAVQDIPGGMSLSLMTAGTMTTSAQVDIAAFDARQKFLGIIGTLNLQVGDRHIFSGNATDTRPLAGADVMLAALSAATTGTLGATDFEAAVTAWFDAPPGGGGFMDVGYLGGTAPLAAFALGPDEAAALTVTAADPAVRDVLKGLAMAALLAEGAFAGNNIERARIALQAGETLLRAQSPMTELRAAVGSVEAHIERAATRNIAETTALEIIRSGLVAADPYETASALEEITTQMETLYALTARVARLNFAEYM